MKNKRNQKQQKDEAVSLLEELQAYEQAGTRLYLDGIPSGAREITRACIFSEQSDYMRDFISDGTDRITEIHFVKISAGRAKQKKRNK